MPHDGDRLYDPNDSLNDVLTGLWTGQFDTEEGARNVAKAQLVALITMAHALLSISETLRKRAKQDGEFMDAIKAGVAVDKK